MVGTLPNINVETLSERQRWLGWLVTETYQFIITMAIVIGGGYAVLTQGQSNPTLSTLAAGAIGSVLTFWFVGRANTNTPTPPPSPPVKSDA